jgi:uncharacterized protein YbjT (DUF2867 family)
MRALIIGATGLIGSYCLKEMLNDDSYSSVEIWVRKHTGITHLKLTERVINFEILSDLNLNGIDHVFCCLGTTIHKAKTKEAFSKVDKEYVSELAKLAESSECQKFLVVSSIGANKNSKNFYLRTKGEMEELVKKKSVPAIYILQPSMLLGNRKEFRFGEIIGKTMMFLIEFMLIGKMRKYRGIHASTIAKALLQLAKLDKEGVFVLTSDQIDRFVRL